MGPRSTGRPRSRRARQRWSAGTAILPLAALAVVATTMPAPAVGASPHRAAPAPPVPAAAADQAPASQPALITATSSGRLKVVARKGRYLVRLGRLGTAETTRGPGTTRLRTARALARRWNRLPGPRRGVVTGTSRSGKSQRIWATFGTMRPRAKGRLVVRAFPQSGTVAAPVRAKAGYPLYSVAAPAARTVALRSGSITATGGRSTKWQFSGSAPSATLIRQSGSRWTISLPALSPRLVGVQPNRSAAGMPLADIVSGFPAMRSGATPPRLVVEGRSLDGRSRSLVFTPTDLASQGGALTVTAELVTRLDRRGVRAVRRVSTAGVLLEVANPGRTGTAVVSTGDGYASGEAARYAGTYLNGNLAPGTTTGAGTGPLPERPLRLKRWQLFCSSIDLACADADVVGATVRYRTDPAAVYEAGSWEQADQGVACHRSRTSPGVWLARHLAREAGGTVRHINLACSGAGTGAVADEQFNGQAPQARELAQLAAWVPVSHVVSIMGGADAGLADVMDSCAAAPLRSIGAVGVVPETGALVAAAGRYADDMLPDATAAGQEAANVNFARTALCSGTRSRAWEEATGALASRVGTALTQLHRAAPAARIVAATYPALLPQPQDSSFPRQRWWDWLRPWILAGRADSPWLPPEADQVARWQQRLGLAPAGSGAFTDGVAAADPTAMSISRQAYAGTNTFGSGTGTFGNWAGDFFGRGWFLEPASHGVDLFGADARWLAGTAMVQLNRAVAAGVASADPQRQWATLVDTTQLFNGRQPGSTFVGHTAAPVAQVWGGSGEGRGPAVSRAVLATNGMPGATDPLLCGPGEVDDDDSGACVGTAQEAWHPNWLGQAALGQCLAAAVADGRPAVACVRSIGDGSSAARQYPPGDFTDTCTAGAAASPPCPLREAPSRYSGVTGTDGLCLDDPEVVLTDQAAGRRTGCTGGIDPYPRWDDDTWSGGRVAWRGQRVYWG